jgi:hypothetical protein
MGQDAAGGVKGTATVYFFWEKEWPQRHLLEIWFDDVELARLENSRYFGAKLETGRHTFKTQNKGDDPLTFDVEGDRTYYIEAKFMNGGWQGHHLLHLLDPKLGELIVQAPAKFKLKKLDSDNFVDKTRIIP